MPSTLKNVTRLLYLIRLHILRMGKAESTCHFKLYGFNIRHEKQVSCFHVQCSVAFLHLFHPRLSKEVGHWWHYMRNLARQFQIKTWKGLRFIFELPLNSWLQHFHILMAHRLLNNWIPVRQLYNSDPYENSNFQLSIVPHLCRPYSSKTKN